MKLPNYCCHKGHAFAVGWREYRNRW